MAIGQLLDYQRFEKDPAGTNLAVLLPSEPAAEMVELLHSQNIAVTYPTNGEWVTQTPDPPVMSRQQILRATPAARRSPPQVSL